MNYITRKSALHYFHPVLGNRYQVKNGLILSPYKSYEVLETLRRDFDTTPNDIVVANFWKTGAHLLKKILLECIQRSKSMKKEYDTVPSNHRLKSTNISTNIPVVEEVASIVGIDDWQKWVNDTDDGYPRILHTHLPFSHVPFANIHSDTKTLYITRNPKDTAVSMHFFCCDYKNSDNITRSHNIQYNGNIENISDGINSFLLGFTQCGDYWDHNISWFLSNNQKKINSDNLLILYYENIINSTMESIKQIAKFINKDKELTDYDFECIANKISFKNMKQEYIQAEENMYDKDNMSANTFFRSGMINDYKNYFDDNMSHLFDEKTRIKFSKIPQSLYYQQLQK